MVSRSGPQRRSAQGWLSVSTLLALGLCLVACLAAAAVSTFVFDRLPHVEDDVAFLFQARTIAAGSLVAQAPPRPEFFDIPFVLVRDGMWFGKYPPGYPAVLALGVLAGQPWLLNPLLGAACVGLVYLIGRRLYGAGTGLLAAALTVASPFFLLQAGSFLSHVAALFWALLVMWFFVEVQASRSRLAALAAGLALGMLFLTRPLTAVGVALPFALWAGFEVLRRPARLVDYLPLVAAFLPFLGGFLAYNALTTGDPLRSAYELYWPYDRIGFGPGHGTLPDGHTLQQAWVNTRINLDALSSYLYGWPARLSLVPAALAVLLALGRLAWQRARGTSGGERGGASGVRGVPDEAWDFVSAGVFVGLVAVHLAYWTYGHMYGPRYYFEALGALALLSARGVLGLAGVAGWVAARAGARAEGARQGARAATLLVVAALVVHSFLNFVPAEFGRFVRWYDIDASGLRVVEAAQPRNAVVFVQRKKWTDYAPFFSQNHPSLQGEVVYAIDRGAGNEALMALYPGREFYRYADGVLTPLAAP